MKPSELDFKPVGCCNEYMRAVVDVEAGAQAIVTDNGDDSYSVVRVRDGLMVAGSAKTIGADDEV